MYIYIYMHIYYVYICIYTYVYMYMRVYIHIYVCTCRERIFKDVCFQIHINIKKRVDVPHITVRRWPFASAAQLSAVEPAAQIQPHQSVANE